MKLPENRKVLVIAGVAQGFGEAIAQVFMRAGYFVAGLSRSGEWGFEFERAFEGLYGHFLCDVTDEVAVGNVIDQITEEIGTPTVMIYNAMSLIAKPFADITPLEMEQTWRTSCLGAMIVSQAVLKGMQKQASGTIIFSGATASRKGGARFAAFASAKFALRGMAQSLAREYGPKGIHIVHTVLDGLIWSPQTRSRFEGASEDACFNPFSIASQYLQLTLQEKSAWTHELDLRPHSESF